MFWDFHLFLLGLSVGVLGNLLTALADRRAAVRMIPWVAFYAFVTALGTVLVGAGYSVESVTGSPRWTQALVAVVAFSAIVLYWVSAPRLVERFDQWTQRQLLGIEVSLREGEPFDGSNYLDSDYSAVSAIYRLGLRSLDHGQSYRVHAEIVSFEGGIEDVTVYRRLRFKDTTDSDVKVDYSDGPCVFLDFLEVSKVGSTAARIPFAVEPRFGANVKITHEFSLRIKIQGGPRLVFATVTVGSVFGIPMPTALKTESPD